MFSGRLSSITATIFIFPGDSDILFYATIFTQAYGPLNEDATKTEAVTLAIVDPSGGAPTKSDYFYYKTSLQPAGTKTASIFVQGGTKLVGHDGTIDGVASSNVQMNVFAREIIDLGQPSDRR